MTTSLFWIPVGLYLVGWLAEFLRYWSDHWSRLRWSRTVLGVGWGANTFLLASLVVQEGFGLSVLLIAAAWLAILLYYTVMHRRPSAVLPFVIPPFAIALLITAYFASEQVLMGRESLGLTLPVTRDILTAHIVSVLAGILLFGLACLVSIVYLYEEYRLKAKRSMLSANRLPSLGALENYNHKAITLGFFFMTVGLLLGLVVAGVNTLPHRMFSARQIIPTLVWVVYAVFLLSHDLHGRRGRFGAIWSIVGFAVVVTSLVFEILFLTTGA
ncbi:MAG TPA: cytochrome c biogenesis protein CcsA [bacterium]|nr:cytochrome c biogenesis protein CcsA [bacterium]